jgi:type II secretory pathway predicted ATPase ExeA
MYEAFYQMSCLPFENTPDPRFFYASDQHREALAAIEYTIRMRKGYVLITGGIGSGKTTVGRTMCDRCASTAQVIHLAHGSTSATELLRQLLRAMEVRFHRDDEHATLLEKLRKNLLARLQEKRPVVILVDEAQTLNDEALEELRLLSNFDTATRKLIQVVLVGHPELRKRLCDPRFEALRQRIVLAKQLQPLSPEDTKAYIQHRLRAASTDARNVRVSFSEGAIREIHRHSQGTPRLINFVCDNCLLLGFVREARQIDSSMVHTVIADMMPAFGAGEAPQLRMTGST